MLPSSSQSFSGLQESMESSSFGPNSSMSPPPIILSIAGYDPSGGAGVLADLKTFAALGVYGMACVTALTVQSTQGVRRVHGVDPSIVIETLDCLSEDASFGSIKVGMLGSASMARTVSGWLRRAEKVPTIFDPVLKSSSGKDLLEPAGLNVLKEEWLACSDWITPNLEELAALTDFPVPVTAAQTEDAAYKLQQLAAQQGNGEVKLVVTGGHADAPNDLLLMGNTCRWYSGHRIETTSTHGTGCAFSSALAARVALGDVPEAAVHAAKEYVSGALRHAYPVGKGKGPLNHFWQTV